MPKTQATIDPKIDDALLYAPAWTRKPGWHSEVNVAPASDPLPRDGFEGSPPPRMPIGIGGPNIEPPPLPSCARQEGVTAVKMRPLRSSSRESNVVPERLRRIRLEQTTRQIARLSFLLMVAGVAAYGLTVITSRYRTELVSPADESATYGVRSAPNASLADVAPVQGDALLARPAPHAAAGPDREAVVQAPAVEMKVAPEEIAMLLSRGQSMFKVGDIAAARMALRRAAEAGNSEAAFLLAATFDPIVLREAGVMGFPPDLTQALFWYEKASALGSQDANRRIERLGRVGGQKANVPNSSTR